MNALRRLTSGYFERRRSIIRLQSKSKQLNENNSKEDDDDGSSHSIIVINNINNSNQPFSKSVMGHGDTFIAVRKLTAKGATTTTA